MRNVFWAESHIRMISEGLCDTEDWNNDSENLDTIWTLGQIVILMLPVIMTVYKMNK